MDKRQTSGGGCGVGVCGTMRVLLHELYDAGVHVMCVTTYLHVLGSQ